MKRILGAVIGGLLLTMVTIHGAWAFDIKDVAAMHKDGVADSLIIQKIVYSGVRFHLESKHIGYLKGEGVSDEVISTMLRTEAHEYADPNTAADPHPYYAYYPHYYYAPYYYSPYYYSPYYYGPHYYGPYFPRISVGLNFGYYGHYGGAYYRGGYHGGYGGGYGHWHR